MPLGYATNFKSVCLVSLKTSARHIGTKGSAKIMVQFLFKNNFTSSLKLDKQANALAWNEQDRDRLQLEKNWSNFSDSSLVFWKDR